LIAHLAELEIRGLHLADGWPSLFACCTGALRLSEHAAYGRITAARVARRFPVILDLLAEGAVNLTTVVLLAPHLTPENHRALLEETRGKSRREVERLMADLRPLPPVPSTVRRLPAPRPVVAVAAPIAQGAGVDGLPPAAGAMGTEAAPEAAAAADALALASAPQPRPSVVAPLGRERYKIAFTAGAETCDKLERARNLLRHQIPDGDLGAIFDRALDALLDKLAREKAAGRDRGRVRFRRPSGEWCGNGMAGGARSSARAAGVARRGGRLSTITWCRPRWVAARR
jgi:hypothetical protein